MITIITATYNSAKTLEHLADSIRGQSYKEVQWIVIDGASTDKTMEIIKQNDDIVSYSLSEPDEGIYDAWNKALIHIKGDWIIFIGSDDELSSPKSLKNAVAQLQSLDNKFEICYGKVTVTSDDEPIYELGKEFNEEQFQIFLSPPHGATFHRREVFEKIGDFDINFKIAGDYDLLMRYFICGGKFLSIV